MKTRRNPDRRLYRLIVANRDRFFGSRSECERKARSYSKAARPLVVPASTPTC